MVDEARDKPREVFTEFQQEIIRQCRNIEEKLLGKNRKYGSSVTEPVKIFSKLSADDRMGVRMDDKLSRIANRQDDEDEDPEFDLCGYLILEMARKEFKRKAEEIKTLNKIDEERKKFSREYAEESSGYTTKVSSTDKGLITGDYVEDYIHYRPIIHRTITSCTKCCFLNDSRCEAHKCSGKTTWEARRVNK